MVFGNPQTALVTTKNQGAAGTGAGYTVCVLNYWTGEELAKSVKSLAAGASEAHVFVVPEHWAGLSMVVTADCTAAVAESNKANNQEVVSLNF